MKLIDFLCSLTILILLCACLVFTGCTSQKSEGSGLPVRALELIRAALDAVPDTGLDIIVSKGDEQFDLYYLYLFDGDASLLTDGAIALRADGVDELAILQPGEGITADQLMTAARENLTRQKERYKMYDNARVALLEQALIWEKNGCVFLVVHEKGARLKQLLNDLIAHPDKIPALPDEEETAINIPSEQIDMIGEPDVPGTENTDSAEQGADASGKIDTGSPEKDTPVPGESGADLSALDGALFIGDSRLQSLIEGADLNYGANYTVVGISISAVFTEPLVKSGSEVVSIAEALRRKCDYPICFLMLGFNELGWESIDTFLQYYENLIDLLKECDPDMQIFILLQFPVTEKYAASQEYENNDRIRLFNGKIADLAEQTGVTCVDLYTLLADENGNLPEEVCEPDVVHLKYSEVPAVDSFLASSVAG